MDGSSRWRIFLLGTFEVWRGEERTEAELWRSRSVRKLLAYLLLRHPEAASREEIEVALFPSPECDSSARSFYYALAGLRENFRRYGVKQVVGCMAGNYALDPGQSFWVDVWEFLSAMEEGARLPGAEGLARWERAIALYRGEFLAGIRSCVWVEGEREKFRRAYLQACRRKGEALLSSGRWEEALETYQAGFLRYPERGELLIPLAQLALRVGERAALQRALSLHLQRLRRLHLSPLPEVADLLHHLSLPGT